MAVIVIFCMLSLTGFVPLLALIQFAETGCLPCAVGMATALVSAAETAVLGVLILAARRFGAKKPEQKPEPPKAKAKPPARDHSWYWAQEHPVNDIQRYIDEYSKPEKWGNREKETSRR